MTTGRVFNCIALLIFALACGFSLSAQGMDCVPESAFRLTFGQYDPRSPDPLDVQGSMSIQCTPNSPGEILDLAATLVGATEWQFYLYNLQTGEKLRIGLYRDSARAKAIDTQNLFGVRVPLARPITFNVPLYGRIPALQNVSVGNYQADFALLINY